MDTPIKITERAAEEIKTIIANKQVPEGYGLRIGVRGGGGCGGASFYLGFDQEKEKDLVYEMFGVTIYLAKPQMMYLLDLEIDFEERREEKGFVFNKQTEPLT